MSTIYHRSTYQEDLQGSEQYKQVKKQQAQKTSNYIKVALLICTIPFLIDLLGLIKEIPSYIYYFTFGSAFLLAFSAIMRFGDDLQRHLKNCRNCKSKLKKEIQDSCEFYVCHECKTFIRGEDWNTRRKSNRNN